MGRVVAASVTFSPTKPRRISGSSSAADQLCFVCPFIGICPFRHRSSGFVAGRFGFLHGGHTPFLVEMHEDGNRHEIVTQQ
jgi:hypothetical protein